MLDPNKCPECDEYWITCPCCNHTFCDRCGLTEDEAQEQGYFDDDDEEG